MAKVTEDVLPMSSTQKHHLFPTTSLRRRRFLVFLFICFNLCALSLWGFHFFIRKYRSEPPLSGEADYHPPIALTSLGLKAEQVYRLGTLERSHYQSSLESFLIDTFPSRLRPRLTDHLHRFLDSDSTRPLPETPKIIWQTNNIQPQNQQMQSWQALNQDHEYRFLNNADAEEWIHQNFGGSTIEWAWNFLPHPVMRADLLRYLLLLVEGGIYSDVDTTCLKPVSYWGADPEVSGQEEADGPPNAVVGIEADVGDRADWHQWWSRPIQIAQWTMALSPGHPVLLDVVRRIYTSTIAAERWLRSDPALIKENLLYRNITVVEWTGPAVFTDATIRFLGIESGLRWPDLRGLTKPLRVGSITVLPVTGFSPGVGNFNAQAPTDKQAMVLHDFRGSWKEQQGH